MNKKLNQKLIKLPTSPGVYFHKNKKTEIIYVGKAAILKNRVRQYFQKSRLRDPKTDLLVAEIYDTDWIELDSEAEALFLEAELIKRYMPKYNILLRDDKSSSFIRIDIKSQAPSLTITRRPLDDGAQYFGPFISAGPLRKALKYLRKIFPYSTHLTLPPRACLQYHLGLCPGPETATYNRDDYIKDLKNIIFYIKGQKTKIIKKLESEMQQASKCQDYEQAAKLRNQLLDLRSIQAQVIFGDNENIDLSKDHALHELHKLFGLKEPPKYIAAFDISHLQGTNVVGSEVVFSNGAPDKKNYRKYKMHSQSNDDYLHIYEIVSRSLASSKNITANLMIIDGGKGQLGSAIKACQEKNVNIPIIAIAKKYEEVIIQNKKSCLTIDSAYLSKLQGQTKVGTTEFTTIILPPNSNIIKLFQRIRDESHRFAVSYHTYLKIKQQTSSPLDEIPGIGPKTKKKLLKELGSIKAIKESSDQELVKIIGQNRTKIIKQHLN